MLVSETEDNGTAIRDIAEGEEICHNYDLLGIFTKTFQKLMVKYDMETYLFSADFITDKSYVIPLDQL